MSREPNITCHAKQTPLGFRGFVVVIGLTGTPYRLWCDLDGWLSRDTALADAERARAELLATPLKRKSTD